MTTIKHIEISGRVFTGPRPNNSYSANFVRESEPVSFCLLEGIDCPYYHIDGINLIRVASRAAAVVGGGFYGIATYEVE